MIKSFLYGTNIPEFSRIKEPQTALNSLIPAPVLDCTEKIEIQHYLHGKNVTNPTGKYQQRLTESRQGSADAEKEKQRPHVCAAVVLETPLRDPLDSAWNPAPQVRAYNTATPIAALTMTHVEGLTNNLLWSMCLPSHVENRAMLEQQARVIASCRL